MRAVGSGDGRVALVAVGGAVLLLGLSGVGAGAAVAQASGPQCQGQRATLVGRPGHNKIVGTKHPDVIVARGDTDNKIVPRGGGDRICAGRGFDRVVGSNGKDKVFGGGDDDTLEGGRQADKLFGEDGDDELLGDDGQDKLDGGDGSDACTGDDLELTIVNCEADLAVDVTGPGTAAAGTITYTASVTNNGPSPVYGWSLSLASDNSHLQCDAGEGVDGPADHLFAFFPGVPAGVAVGSTTSHDFSLTCVVEGPPPRNVFVEAGLSDTAAVALGVDFVDPVAGNDSDRQTTTVE